MQNVCLKWGVYPAYCDDNAIFPALGEDDELIDAYNALVCTLDAPYEVAAAIRRMIAAGDTNALLSWDIQALFVIGSERGYDIDECNSFMTHAELAINDLAAVIDRRLLRIENLVDPAYAPAIWSMLYRRPWCDVTDDEIRSLGRSP